MTACTHQSVEISDGRTKIRCMTCPATWPGVQSWQSERDMLLLEITTEPPWSYPPTTEPPPTTLPYDAGDYASFVATHSCEICDPSQRVVVGPATVTYFPPEEEKAAERILGPHSNASDIPFPWLEAALGVLVIGVVVLALVSSSGRKVISEVLSGPPQAEKVEVK